METNEKDIIRKLFADMSDESLPFNFDEKVMARVHREALLRRRRNKILEISGYISGAVAVIVVCVLVLYYMGVSFQAPEINWSVWTFPKPDYSMYDLVYNIKSPSFGLSMYIGVLVLSLLVIDSAVRRHIEKTKKM
jgi:hypothetical protein